jgi:hypothetical protein
MQLMVQFTHSELNIGIIKGGSNILDVAGDCLRGIYPNEKSPARITSKLTSSCATSSAYNVNTVSTPSFKYMCNDQSLALDTHIKIVHTIPTSAILSVCSER